MSYQQLLAQIERSMRAVGRQERQTVALERFEIFISPGQLDHLTFAVPLPGDADDWTESVANMLTAFDQHDKRPRLEYIADLHPKLGPALEQAGLVCESRAPVMILDTAALTPSPSQLPTANYRRLTAVDSDLLRAYLINQSIAYGGSGNEDALGWLPNLQQGLANGGAMGAVLEQAEELTSGAVIQIGEGIGELAGVWSAPQRRGQGLAYTLCQRLLAEYTAVGYAHCWLSAAEGAQRLYEKLGFVEVGTQLNYGRPSAEQ
jgi:ribosomal protein S18 acetylase RimI-like enzyme